MNYIGIDPGLSGGLVVINEFDKILMASKLPFKEHILQSDYLIKVLEPYLKVEYFLTCEKITARPVYFNRSIKSEFGIAEGFGQLKAFFYINSIKIEFVTPQAWQKAIFTTILGKSTGDTKERAALCANAILGDYYKQLLNRNGKPISGLVDAFLIAVYGKHIQRRKI